MSEALELFSQRTVLPSYCVDIIINNVQCLRQQTYMMKYTCQEKHFASL